MIRRLRAGVAVAIAIFAGAGATRAQDVLPAGSLRPLCPDRPSKGTSACTVDNGRLQLETDIVNFTHDHTGDVGAELWLFTNPTLKFGLADTLDIEASLVPWEEARTHDMVTGARSTVSGIGDLYLRAKLNLAGNAGGSLGAAIAPYVKAPTAKAGLGDGAWEAGVLIPLSYNLPDGWSVSITPEADAFAGASGSDRHAAISLPVGLSHAVGPISATIELWTQQDFEPSGAVRQYSLDFAAAWQPAHQPNLQLDGGMNFGLNRATPDVQIYVGITRRF